MALVFTVLQYSGTDVRLIDGLTSMDTGTANSSKQCFKKLDCMMLTHLFPMFPLDLP